METPIQVGISILEIEYLQISELETLQLLKYCGCGTIEGEKVTARLSKGAGGLKEKSETINSDWDQLAYRHRFYNYYSRFGGLLPKCERDLFQKPRLDRLEW